MKKKKMSSKSISLIIYIMSFGILQAQVNTLEKPVSFSLELDSKYDVKLVKTMPRIDIEKLTEEDAINEKLGVSYYRFGYSHSVDFNLENSGQWFNLPDGARLWQLQIVCPDALSISFIFSQFWLPEGAKFFIYSNDNREQYFESFISANTNKDDIRGLGTAPHLTDAITLEYYLPKDAKDKGIISIDSVVYGYRGLDFFQNTSNKMQEIFQNNNSSCEIDISCPEGIPWQAEKRAVAMIVQGSAVRGTGSLINNTNNDFKPLFLTAEHVIEDITFNYHPGTMVNLTNHTYFVWNYENPVCGQSPRVVWQNSNFITYGGAKLLARSVNYTTDFALLELNTHPATIPAGYTPYYLGWDRRENPFINPTATGGVCIHHPVTLPKSIAVSNNIRTKHCMGSSFNYFYNNYWDVEWINTGSGFGSTMRISSGSALINSNRKVIGQLYGRSYCTTVNAPCNVKAGPYSFYGKLNLSWTGGGQDNNRLSNWLDPRGINTTGILNGISHCRVTALTFMQIGNPKTVSCETINIQQKATVPTGNRLILNAKEVNIYEFEVQAGADFEINIMP